MTNKVIFEGKEELEKALSNQKFGTTTEIGLSLGIDPVSIKVEYIKQKDNKKEE